MFINNILREYINRFIIVYLDDILVYSRTKEKYVQHMRNILQALKNTNLKIKVKKSVFHIKEVLFLDFIVFTQDLKMNSEKIQSVIKWLTLISVKEVQVFLDFINFYKKFVKKYSKLATLLTQLIKKKTEFN